MTALSCPRARSHGRRRPLSPTGDGARSVTATLLPFRLLECVSGFPSRQALSRHILARCARSGIPRSLDDSLPPNNSAVAERQLGFERQEKIMDKATGIEKVSEQVGGYDVPIDPMDDLGCDSCQ